MRRPLPTFSEQFRTYAERLWSSKNMDIKYFSGVIGTHIFGAFAFLLVILIFRNLTIRAYQARVEKDKLKESLAIAERDKNATIQERNTYQDNYSKAIQQRNKLLEYRKQKQDEIKLLQSKIEEKDEKIQLGNLSSDVLQEVEKEKADLESKLNKESGRLKEKDDELEIKDLELNELNNELKEKEAALNESASEIERLKENIANRDLRFSVSERAIDSFIKGANISSQNTINLHPEAYKDVRRLEKKTYSYQSIIESISRVAKTDISDSSFGRTFEKLKDYDKIFHNKKAAIRIYFKISNNSILILGIWDQSDAPHSSKGDGKKWRILQSRLESDSNHSTPSAL